MLTRAKKRRLNPMLLNVILISGGLHLLALFILGGITVVKYIIPDEAEFEEPPAIVEEEPPPEVKIELKPKANQPQSALNNLQMKQVGDIKVDAIDVNLPDINDSFTVSAGLGGSGSGGLLGGTSGSIGLGMSDVSVFGLKTRAERILFVIDANRQMLTDKKGGLNSYKVIKDEITDMVGNLSAGTLFNVMIVDRRKNKRFKNQLVPAGKNIHQELVNWMAPINSNAQSPGLESASGTSNESIANFAGETVHEGIKWSGHRDNETAFITQVALEQNVDAVFFIAGYHGGFDRIRRQPNERENAQWDRHVQGSSYQKQLSAHQLERPLMEERVRKELSKVNEKRKKQGQPSRVLDSRYGVHTKARELSLAWENPHPGWQPAYFIESREVSKYFKNLVEKLYTEKQLKEPSMNVVLFLAGDEDIRQSSEDNLKDYVSFFGGKMKMIRGLNEIKSARSSANTPN